ncbi:MAG: carboxymuconolactone decarboxylase family protein [Marinomonas sp.]
MEDRVNLGKASPVMYKSVVQLDCIATQFIEDAGIAEGFSHLLKLRASQINQCAFCIRLHSKDASDSGEPIERISLVSAWRESLYFDNKEKAALELLESITLISQGQVPDTVYKAATKVLTKAQIAAIEWLSIVINTWNRVAISSRYPVLPANPDLNLQFT